MDQQSSVPGEGPVPAQVVQEPPPRPAPPAPRARGCLPLVFGLMMLVAVPLVLMVLLVVAVASLDTETTIEEEYHSLERLGSEKVAIITVEGVILDGEEGFVKEQIDRVREDDDVKAVVLRVNSPGGTVNGSDVIYHHLNKLREERDVPIVVSMGGVAASGGYYVSMAVGETPDTIYAEPTTWTGSIGVIIPHYDISGLLEKLEIEDDSIASHPLKKMGSMTTPMTEEEREIFQGLVHDSFERFKAVIKSGRPKFKENEEALEQVATGQVFTADQAMKHGLVDKQGYLEDAIDRAIELGGLERSDTKVIKYKEPFAFGDLFLGAESKRPVLDASALLELATPRAYYLCTWLPGLKLPQ